MAYEFFACLSTTDGNRVPFYPPEGYNPDDFTLLLRQIEGVVANGRYPHGPPLNYFGDVQCYDDVVEKVTGNRDCLLCCGMAPVDSDQPDLNRGWPSANHSQRLAIAQAHRYYVQGSLYFMAHDPRVPNFTRTDSLRYGYCKDEYARFGNFPPQIYVRISNRLQGEALLTQNNIVNPQVKPDGVAMGCWEFDQHTVSRHVVPDPKDPTRKVVTNEGFFRAALGSDGLSCDHPDADCTVGRAGGWYDVPFGVMVPKRGQASNLLLPVAISTTSVAYASTRIENMYMDLGSAAGVAVAQLLTRGAGVVVQDTNISEVQTVLSTVYGQRFHGPGTGPPTPPPPPAPKWYNVSGAGSQEWNGRYSLTGQHADGRAVYSNPSGNRSLYSYASTWRLGIEGHEIYYVAGSPTPGFSPPLSGWTVANGTAPAPVLIAGPA